MSNPAIDRRYYLVTMLQLRAAGMSLTPDALAVLTSSRRGQTRDELDAGTMLGRRSQRARSAHERWPRGVPRSSQGSACRAIDEGPEKRVRPTRDPTAARKADLIEKSIAALGEATVAELSRDAVQSDMVVFLHEPDLPLDDARVARLVEHFYVQDRSQYVPTAVQPSVRIREEHFAIDGSEWDEDVEKENGSADGSGIPSESVVTAVSTLSDTGRTHRSGSVFIDQHARRPARSNALRPRASTGGRAPHPDTDHEAGQHVLAEGAVAQGRE